MRLETQKRKKENRFLAYIRRLFFVCFLIFFILAASLFGFGVGMFIEQKNYIENIGVIEVPEATFIYAVNTNEKTGNNEVIAKIFKENRINVTLGDVPQNLQNAVIAIEDKRFYEHNGVDLRGVGRALVTNILKGSYSQGGSTISMQLARNVKLNSKKTMSRKIQEIIIAAQIEQTMSKEDILEAYLNSIYFGSGAFGVEAASLVYFGKSVKDIGLSEAALLAGLPKAPSAYSPHKNYEAAVARRNVVLEAMREQGFITDEEYREAKKENIEIKKKVQQRDINKYPHIVNAVIEELKKKFDEDQIYYGGLRVYTTIDTRIQDAANDSVQKHMGSVHKRKKSMECALISVDPSTGYIEAMVGSVDPKSEFNRCTQARRQPGSVFKPVVYYTALEKLNWTPDTRISNARFSYKGWTPKNFDGRYGGNPTMRQAIMQSINLPAIRAGEACGMESVCEMAKRLGINDEISPYLATCIGSGSIRLIDMIQVFNVTANDGIIYVPTLIKRVYDTSGTNILADNTKRNGKRVLSSALVKTMDSMLRSVVTGGTGRPVSRIKEARGKTGTNGKTDVSFAGYVPEGLCAMVWIGDDGFKTIPNYYSGGGTCGPIWADFMEKALPVFAENKSKDKTTLKTEEKKEEKAIERNRKEYREKTENGDYDAEEEGETIDNTESEKSTVNNEETDAEVVSETETESDNVIFMDVCPASNKLPNSNCPVTVLKKFRQGKAPSGVCDIH